MFPMGSKFFSFREDPFLEEILFLYGNKDKVLHGFVVLSR